MTTKAMHATKTLFRRLKRVYHNSRSNSRSTITPEQAGKTKQGRLPFRWLLLATLIVSITVYGISTSSNRQDGMQSIRQGVVRITQREMRWNIMAKGSLESQGELAIQVRVGHCQTIGKLPLLSLFPNANLVRTTTGSICFEVTNPGPLTPSDIYLLVTILHLSTRCGKQYSHVASGKAR